MSRSERAGTPSNRSRNGALRALTREQNLESDEQAGSLGSLDMDRLSDILKSSENAEIATVFALSTRWRMQPNKCKCGIQRTHLTAPGGIWDAVPLIFSGPNLLLWADVGLGHQFCVQAQGFGPKTGCSVALTASRASKAHASRVQHECEGASALGAGHTRQAARVLLTQSSR